MQLFTQIVILIIYFVTNNFVSNLNNRNGCLRLLDPTICFFICFISCKLLCLEWLLVLYFLCVSFLERFQLWLLDNSPWKISAICKNRLF